MVVAAVDKVDVLQRHGHGAPETPCIHTIRIAYLASSHMIVLHHVQCSHCRGWLGVNILNIFNILHILNIFNSFYVVRADNSLHHLLRPIGHMTLLTVV